MSNNSTIQSRFFFVAMLSVIILLGFTYTFFWVSSARTSQISLLRSIAEITQRHMEGDMMHDAIRADVLAGLLAAVKAESSGVAQAQTDFEDHYNSFYKNLKENSAEDLPENIKNMFDATLAALEKYGAAAKSVMVAASSGG
ncbi:MAG: hypothetical protein HY370_09705, partial [Proteobacteria bacterium]|nr:hypothetical protein [Pseudomonadota bacterium]